MQSITDRSTRPADTKSQSFRDDVLNGLSAEQKSIPSKYFYDERGSELFDAITKTPEYYPTNVEEGIMETNIDEIVNSIGSRALFVELGSGSSTKTRVILDALNDAAGYIPIDISGEYLEIVADQLRIRYPDLDIRPLAADYTRDLVLPSSDLEYKRVVAYYPGSTIGNFEPTRARAFLKKIRGMVGEGGALLIGVDLMKDRGVLEAAYNDEAGVTAEFNLNLLRRINRELDADFDLSNFSHRAVLNEQASRIEMHLVSDIDQTVTVSGQTFSFNASEYIYTESSYKYTSSDFIKLAAEAGFESRNLWVDDKEYFSIHFLETTTI